MRLRTRIIVSGGCALACALSCIAYAGQVEERSERLRADVLARYGGEVVTLAVASEEIPAGDVVSRLNAAEREWLVDLVPEGALQSLADCAGKAVSSPVAAGAPICEINFREEKSALEVPDGKVAVSIALQERLALAEGAGAGSDLLAYRVAKAGAELIAKDVTVLSLPEERGALVSSGAVTVAVAAEDVAAVLSASAEGSLRLVLPAADAAKKSEKAHQAPTEVPAEAEEKETGSAPAKGEQAVEKAEKVAEKTVEAPEVTEVPADGEDG